MVNRFINETQDNFVVGIKGFKGSGKTLILCLLLYFEYLSGKKIYTNFPVTFPHEILDINKLIDLDENLENCAIGITEMQVIADSRRHGKKQNLLMSYFVLQSRHRSVNLYYDTQFDHQVDKRIRDNVDVDIVCENLYIDSDGDGKNDLFRIITFNRRFNKHKENIVYAKPFWDMYDGKVIIDPFTMNELKNIKKK